MKGQVLFYHGIPSRLYPGFPYFDRAVPCWLFKKQINAILKFLNPIPTKNLPESAPIGVNKMIVTFDDGLVSSLKAAQWLASQGIATVVFIVGEPIFEKKIPWFCKLGWFVGTARRKRIIYHGIGYDLTNPRGFEEFYQTVIKRVHGLSASEIDDEIALLKTILQPERTYPKNDDDFRFATPEELKKAYSKGVLIGVHGWTHTPLIGMSQKVLEKEILVTKLAIEDTIGDPCFVMSYPNGAFDNLSYSIVKHNFEWGFAVKKKANANDKYRYPRVSIGPVSPIKLLLARELTPVGSAFVEFKQTLKKFLRRFV